MPQTKIYETLSACPVCNSPDIHPTLQAKDEVNQLPGTFYLSECRACKIRFQNPRIKKAYIKHYYPNTTFYFDKKYLKHLSLIEKLTFKLFYGYFGNKTMHIKLAQFLNIPPFIPYKLKGKLVEFGCGNGSNLKYFQQLGWQVSGYDINTPALNIARKNGFRVANLNLEADKLSPSEYQYYDAAVLIMVLEHLYDFRRALKICWQALKPGGYLFITIPTYNGVFKIFRTNAYPLQLPTHITFFTHRTIIQLLKEAGYSSPQIKYTPNKKDFLQSWKIYLRNHSQSPLKLMPPMIISLLATIYAFLAIFNFGSRLAIVATKP